MMDFEVRSTWSRSTFGKVLLVIIMVMNFFTIIFSAGIGNFIDQNNYPGGKQAYFDDALHSFVSTYVSSGDGGPVTAGPEYFTFGGPPIGF